MCVIRRIHIDNTIHFFRFRIFVTPYILIILDLYIVGDGDDADGDEALQIQIDLEGGIGTETA